MHLSCYCIIDRYLCSFRLELDKISKISDRNTQHQSEVDGFDGLQCFVKYKMIYSWWILKHILIFINYHEIYFSQTFSQIHLNSKNVRCWIGSFENKLSSHDERNKFIWKLDFYFMSKSLNTSVSERILVFFAIIYVWVSIEYRHIICHKKY